MDIGWVKTENHVTVVINGNPIAIQKGSDRYNMVMKMIRRKNKDGLAKYLYPEKDVEQKTSFKLQGKTVVDKVTGEQLEPVLASKLVDFVNKKLPFTPLTKFFENLKRNPDQNAVKQFFEYLKKYSWPITQDGCFLAYKYVTKLDNGKLVDSHTKTFDNTPGKTVTEDRNRCDPDPRETCSRGLHVAAYPFASNCGGGEVMLEVKVNPKDVVCIPNDHDAQKIRVCRYEVLRQGKDEISQHYVRIQKTEPNLDITASEALDTKVPGRKLAPCDLESMSGAEIIAYAKKMTGKTIPVSPKSKKSVIKHALKILNFDANFTTKDVISLVGLSGSQIIDLVRAQTGFKITLSPKSKRSVIKKAWSILTDHGLNVKVE
jgi:hypothetical protein